MPTFADELRSLGKRRIGLTELRDAYLRAHPEALRAPEPRRLLLDALLALEREGLAVLPKRNWDTSAIPALPRTASLRSVRGSHRARAAQAWLPMLGFAAEERHPARRRHLQAINAFLVSARDRALLPVPTRERSLQIFGDEKQLDELRKGKTSLFEGRVSLDDLRCYPVAPPLPWETPGGAAAGRPILVLENYHSYESFRRWNRDEALYVAVAYGGGNAFRQGAGNLDDLMARTGAAHILYVGDLDPAGADILRGVNERRRKDGQALVKPHCGLYLWLLANGHRRPLDKPPRNGLEARLGDMFPDNIARGLTDLWATGQRIPQESFGLEQLHGMDGTIAAPSAA